MKDAGLMPEGQVRLCVVADGAEWIWQHVQALFPQARQVLDYDHCAQYIHKIAKAHYGTSLQGLEWAEATMTRLYMGKVSAVLGGLRRMQPTSDEAAQAIANGWEYLNEHRGRTNVSDHRGSTRGRRRSWRWASLAPLTFSSGPGLIALV